jgi:hypothetical protein
MVQIGDVLFFITTYICVNCDAVAPNIYWIVYVHYLLCIYNCIVLCHWNWPLITLIQQSSVLYYTNHILYKQQTLNEACYYIYIWKSFSLTFAVTPYKFPIDLMNVRRVWVSDCASDGQNKFARHIYHNHYVFPPICLLTNPLVVWVQAQ